MKLFTAERVKLLAACQKVAAVVPSRSPKPILQCLLLRTTENNKLEIVGTDLEISIAVELDVEAGPGLDACVLSAGRLLSILRESNSDTVEVTLDDSAVTLTLGRSTFRLPSQDSREFPQVKPFASSAYHEFKAADLRRLLRRTSFACDGESLRFALGGVLLELTESEATAVATDGKRLSSMGVPAVAIGGHATGNSPTILPEKAVGLLLKIIEENDSEVQVAVAGNSCELLTADATISTRLIEGRFPDWRKVFPAGTPADQQFELLVSELVSVLRQVRVTTDDESRGVDFAFRPGILTLSAGSQIGTSRVELPIKQDAKALDIKLDPELLLDFLRSLDAECQVTLTLRDGDTGAVFVPSDGGRYIAMPLARDR